MSLKIVFGAAALISFSCDLRRCCSYSANTKVERAVDYIRIGIAGSNIQEYLRFESKGQWRRIFAYRVYESALW